MFQIGDSQFPGLSLTWKFPEPAKITVSEISLLRSSKCHTFTLTPPPLIRPSVLSMVLSFYKIRRARQICPVYSLTTANCFSQTSRTILISSEINIFNHISNLGLIAKLSLSSHFQKEHGPRLQDNAKRGPESAISSLYPGSRYELYELISIAYP